MKSLIALLAAIAAALSVSTAALAKDDHTAKHGGVFVESKAADYELVAKADSLRLYVSDHGKPMDLSKASAKVTVLSGSDKQDFDLAPAGDHLAAKGPVKLGAGSKAVAVVSVAGKPLGTARFILE